MVHSAQGSWGFFYIKTKASWGLKAGNLGKIDNDESKEMSEDDEDDEKQGKGTEEDDNDVDNAADEENNQKEAESEAATVWAFIYTYF